MTGTRVVLSVVKGRLKGTKHVFDHPTQCLIGRANDCDIQLSADGGFANVSRRHCELDIDPPAVRVRDLGSRNGTWLNGVGIHRTDSYLEGETASREPGDFVPLQDGDEIGIGSLIFRVNVWAVDQSPERVGEAVFAT